MTTTARAAKAFADEFATLRAAPEGQRNNTLNQVVFSLAQLVAAGEATAEELAEVKVIAIERGLPRGEVEATYQSAFKAGSQQPRVPPVVNGVEVEEVAAEVLLSGSTGAGEPQAEPPCRFTFTPGGTFVLDGLERPRCWWGRGDVILAADGESVMIAGGQGAGKTTLGQQLALGRADFAEHRKVLGMPVTPGEARVLYLAMDRPRQAAASLRRMVRASQRAELDDRLIVYQGPPPRDLAANDFDLVQMARAAGADTVVVDSLKDAAIGLDKDQVGAGWNRARQRALTAGVQLIELHHNRKRQANAQTRPPSLDDIYGSTWITSGVGSVILLDGAPGDGVVKLHHLKQPVEVFGPVEVRHDHTIGRSEVWHQVDVLAVLRSKGSLTGTEAAQLLYDTTAPTSAQRLNGRRKLQRLTDDGLAYLIEDGDKATSTPARWGPVT